MDDAERKTTLETALREHKKVGDYAVVSGIRVGGFSVVLKGATPSGDPCAIKMPRRAEYIQAFGKIAELYKKLGKCEEIAGLIDSVDGSLILEYCDYPNLGDILDGEGTLPLEDALRITADALNGFEYMHSKGVFHGDVQPANFHVQRPGNRVKIIDIGHAEIVEQDLSKLKQQSTYYSQPAAGFMVGYDKHYSPELLTVDGEKPNQYTDLYGLTKTLHKMLFGDVRYQQKPLSCAALNEASSEKMQLVDRILEIGFAEVRKRHLDSTFKDKPETERGFQSAAEMKKLVHEALGLRDYTEFNKAYSRFTAAVSQGPNRRIGIHTNLPEIWHLYKAVEKYDGDDHINKKQAQALLQVKTDILKPGFEAIRQHTQQYSGKRYDHLPEHAQDAHESYEQFFKAFKKAPDDIYDMARTYSEASLPFLSTPWYEKFIHRFRA